MGPVTLKQSMFYLREPIFIQKFVGTNSNLPQMFRQATVLLNNKLPITASSRSWRLEWKNSCHYGAQPCHLMISRVLSYFKYILIFLSSTFNFYVFAPKKEKIRLIVVSSNYESRNHRLVDWNYMIPISWCLALSILLNEII